MLLYKVSNTNPKATDHHSVYLAVASDKAHAELLVRSKRALEGKHPFDDVNVFELGVSNRDTPIVI